MSWISSGSPGKHWVFNATHSGITRTSISPTSSTTFLRYNISNTYTFSPEKTYLFKTKVNNFTNEFIYKSLEIRSFGKSFSYNYNATSTQSKLPFNNNTQPVYLNWYVSPNSLTTTNTLTEYFSTYNGFGTHSGSTTASVIQEFSLTEINWKIQGWSWATASNGNNNYEGWRFNEIDESFEFNHFEKSTDYRLSGDGRTSSNYVSQFISYDQFNLEFYFTKQSTAATLDIWMTDVLPPDTSNINTFTASLNNGQKLTTLTQSGTWSFYGVSGNRWLNFVANYSNTNTSYKMDIENINIQGGYSPTDNNTQFVFDSNIDNIIGYSTYSQYTIITTTNLTRHNPTGSVFFGATGNPGFFSNIYGTVVNLSQQVSKLGNGTFKSGIWENGVWNSGWRVDNQIYELSDIIAAFNLNTKNSKWRIQISGSTGSISNFELGDKVAISNIVAIDINEKRKLMKNFFTIINKDDNNIVVEIENNFPIRRIEKDSEFHKIRITKNVWLNGGFLNGYFEGIWNDGLYKGYPFITQMKNTHWIDGVFDGGYFNSFYPEFIFNDTIWTNGNVGLSFSTPHEFLIGDLIVINKDNKLVNLDYDGTASIIEIISDKYIVTDIPWGTDTTLESGLVRRYTSTGLVQNFEFYDNNVSKSISSAISPFQILSKSKKSTDLKSIWKFNSWIDVNYSEESSTNINKEKSFFNSKPNNSINISSTRKYGLGEFNTLNLYGFITKDILSSKSSFRDIDSFNKRKYSLGTKYDIYQDFIGDSSEFNEVFGSGNLFGGEENFTMNGWTYSWSGTFSTIPIPIAFTFSRTVDGTILFEFANESTQFLSLNNNNIIIEKNRYSIIEFDVIRQESDFYNEEQESPINLWNIPTLTDVNGEWTSTPSFPIQSQVNYLKTPSERKIEYFYNRKSLDLGIRSIGRSTTPLGGGGYTSTGSIVELDNIKFYEVDAIPFFQYTTFDYINKSVQVPYQGIAPFIDYENSEFSFVDNIVISLDSIDIQSTGVPIVSSPTGNQIIYADISQSNKFI
jgi:hypothetical protein